MQGLLGSEELAGDETTSGPQLQWATHAEFPSVARLFEHSGEVWRPCKSSRRSGFRDAGRRSRCTPFGLLRGGIHRDCGRPQRRAGYYLRTSRGVYPILTRRTATTDTVVGPNCCMGRKIQRSRRRLRTVYTPAPRKKNTQVQVSQWRRRGVRRMQRSSHHHAGSRPRLRSVTAKPISRQRCSLIWKISLAGWPPSKSVGLLPSRVMLEIPAASRKSSSPTLHEACTLLGAGAGISHFRLPDASSRGSTKNRCTSWPTSPPCRSTCKVRSSSGQAKKLTQRRGRTRGGSGRSNNGYGIHRCSQWRWIRRRRDPATVQCILRTRHEYPDVIIMAHETRVREDQMTLLGESWSWQRHEKEHLHHHCGHFRNLRRVIVMDALERWPLRPPKPQQLSAQGSSRTGVSEETADDTRWKGNAQGQERAPFRQRRRRFAKADSCRRETGPSSETARTGDQRRRGQRRRSKLRLGRDLRQDRPAHLRDIKVGGPCSLHYCLLFPGKQSSQNLSAKRSPQLVPVTTPGGVGSRCLPAHAVVRAVTATKHELGLSPIYRFVSYGSAMEVLALLLRLSHCLRARG